MTSAITIARPKRNRGFCLSPSLFQNCFIISDASLCLRGIADADGSFNLSIYNGLRTEKIVPRDMATP